MCLSLRAAKTHTTSAHTNTHTHTHTHTHKHTHTHVRICVELLRVASKRVSNRETLKRARSLLRTWWLMGNSCMVRINYCLWPQHTQACCYKSCLRCVWIAMFLSSGTATTSRFLTLVAQASSCRCISDVRPAVHVPGHFMYNTP